MNKKIKIICTLGPRSLNKEFLKFSKNKIDLLRLNMSHLNLSDLKKTVKFIKKNVNIPICIDTEGTQIRTKVRKEKDGSRSYIWITARDEHYCQAKDRSQLLESEILQDYNIVFDAVKKVGWDSAKILVIGEPGSGKTLSLKTLTKIKGE